MTLKAVLLNCTLKKSPEVSNTEALMEIVIGHLNDLDVECELIRPVDYAIPFGVVSDMGDGDEWPQILDKILAADILIIGTSIWFGVRNSVSQMVIERLDGTYESRNDVGQYPMYNKVAGVVVKTAGWMAHNVVHLARMLKQHPIPAEGNTVPCKHAG